jgi:hypothetical protein
MVQGNRRVGEHDTATSHTSAVKLSHLNQSAQFTAHNFRLVSKHRQPAELSFERHDIRLMALLRVLFQGYADSIFRQIK